MAGAQIVVQAPAVARVSAEGAAPVRVQASPPAVARISTEGTQGIQGLPGPALDIFALPLAPNN